MPEQRISREQALSTQHSIVEELMAYSHLHDLNVAVVVRDGRGFRVRSYGCAHWGADAMMSIGTVVPGASDVFLARIERMLEEPTTPWQRFCRWLPWNRPTRPPP